MVSLPRVVVVACQLSNSLVAFITFVAVTGDQLGFESRERIFCGEIDGRRQKRVLVKNIGE